MNDLRSDERATSPVALPTFGGPGDKPLVDILDKQALAEAMGDDEPPRHAF